MSNVHVKHLLVGAGVAGLSAARALRELDRDGSVVLIGAESSRPYHRPPLSKAFLRREMAREELFAVAPRWFTDHHVELRTRRRLSRLDVARQSAILDNGEELSFDRLLLATGASPAPLETPGADLPNVFYLRTLDDAATLHNAIDKARREGRPHRSAPGQRGRATVIGAGLLGVEVAASLTQSGLSVDLLASKAVPWNRFAGEVTGRFVQHLLERHGVVVYPAARPERLEGDGRVQRVIVAGASASIDCDFVVACVGSVANRDALNATPIATGKAILVDEQCRTNVPGIFAAGDCCALFDPRFGKHRRVEHWDIAQNTGVLAGRNMAGAGERYGEVNCFTSELFDVVLLAWGDPRFIDRRLIRGTPRVDAPDFIEIGVASDGRVAQILCLRAAGQLPSRPGEDLVTLRELVARRLNVEGAQDRINDPACPLDTLLQ